MQEVSYKKGNVKSTLISNINESMILTVRESGRITGMNEQASDSSFFQQGTFIYSYIHEEDLDLVSMIIQESLQTNKVREFYIRFKDREDTLYLMKIMPLLKNDSEKECLLLFWNHTQTLSRRDQAFTPFITKEQIFHIIAEKIDKNEPFVLVNFQINQLDYVGEVYGKEAEDAVFSTVMNRIDTFYKGKTPFYCLDQHQFFLLHEDKLQADNENQMEHLLTYINTPVSYQNSELKVLVRGGAVRYPINGTTPFALFHHSEIALEIGRKANHLYHLFKEKEQEDYMYRMKLERETIKAVSEDQFILNYQPIIDQKNQRVMAVEALLRWEHPELGIISPNEFIPLLEETNLILQVGYDTLRKVCKQLKKWQEDGLTDVKMHVNVSVRQLVSKQLIPHLHRVLAKEGVKGEDLVFEITESSIMDDSEYFIEVIEEIKRLGIGVSIDDFGTGFSALDYLTRLNVDSLKIDKSFLQRVHRGTKEKAVIKSIISLAHHLNIEVIAEGVEEKAHLTFLEENNCTHMQGFYFSRPLESERTAEFLSLFPKQLLEKKRTM